MTGKSVCTWGSQSWRRLLAGLIPTSVFAVLSVGCGFGGDLRTTTRAARSDTTSVRFRVDVGRRFPISPFIYGVNVYGDQKSGVPWPNHLTLSRVGGNRWSAYNWENNASNAGRDWNFQNDDYLGGDMVAGEAARRLIEAARAKGAGTIVTVPMLSYVARDKDGTNVGIDPTTLGARLASRFVRSFPTRGRILAREPDPRDEAVYQDEFVAWLARRFPGASTDPRTPLFFELDNEPDIWGSTHEEVMPKVHGRMATLTYDELIERSITYARAIKTVDSGAVIFGPSTATWTGASTLARYPAPDPRYGRRFFLDVYLERMRDASRVEGRRLLDVLDIHWYPAAGAGDRGIGDDQTAQTPAMIEARVQAPRSLWDPGYDERSWVSHVQGGPIRLLPLLREKIDACYPGTRVAISEYYYGRGGDISGGIAQADVLGIFGREGVFAATLWPLADLGASPYGGSAERAYRYVIGAFRMYRDYDGQGGAFGPTGVSAQTTDSVSTSVYASVDEDDPRLVLVAINKKARPQRAAVEILSPTRWASATVYTLTADAPEPQVRGALPVEEGARLSYVLPPMSVSTIVLRP